MEDSNTILYEVEKKIATITINRPEKRNALRMEEFDGIVKSLQKAENDSNVHVIRIRSSGDRAFTAGLDLNMIQQMTIETVPELLKYCNKTTLSILRGKKPVICQVQGPAVAWGTILAFCADFVVAGENPMTFFSLPEIDLGLFPATGALTTCLFSVGLRKAREILMIPKRISLDDAEELGLVTQRCELDKLEETTLEFCRNLADKSQNILIPIKTMINYSMFGDIEARLEKETEALMASLDGDFDKVKNFVEKIWSFQT